MIVEQIDGIYYLGRSGLRQGNKAGKISYNRAKVAVKLLFFDDKNSLRSIDRLCIIYGRNRQLLSLLRVNFFSKDFLCIFWEISWCKS